MCFAPSVMDGQVVPSMVKSVCRMVAWGYESTFVLLNDLILRPCMDIIGRAEPALQPLRMGRRRGDGGGIWRAAAAVGLVLRDGKEPIPKRHIPHTSVASPDTESINN